MDASPRKWSQDAQRKQEAADAIVASISQTAQRVAHHEHDLRTAASAVDAILVRKLTNAHAVANRMGARAEKTLSDTSEMLDVRRKQFAALLHTLRAANAPTAAYALGVPDDLPVVDVPALRAPTLETTLDPYDVPALSRVFYEEEEEGTPWPAYFDGFAVTRERFELRVRADKTDGLAEYFRDALTPDDIEARVLRADGNDASMKAFAIEPGVFALHLNWIQPYWNQHAVVSVAVQGHVVTDIPLTPTLLTPAIAYFQKHIRIWPSEKHELVMDRLQTSDANQYLVIGGLHLDLFRLYDRWQRVDYVKTDTPCARYIDEETDTPKLMTVECQVLNLGAAPLKEYDFVCTYPVHSDLKVQKTTLYAFDRSIAATLACASKGGVSCILMSSMAEIWLVSFGLESQKLLMATSAENEAMRRWTGALDFNVNADGSSVSSVQFVSAFSDGSIEFRRFAVDPVDQQFKTIESTRQNVGAERILCCGYTAAGGFVAVGYFNGQTSAETRVYDAKMALLHRAVTANGQYLAAAIRNGTVLALALQDGAPCTLEMPVPS